MPERIKHCPWHETKPQGLELNQSNSQMCIPCFTLEMSKLEKRQKQILLQKIIAQPKFIDRLTAEGIMHLRMGGNN